MSHLVAIQIDNPIVDLLGVGLEDGTSSGIIICCCFWWGVKMMKQPISLGKKVLLDLGFSVFGFGFVMMILPCEPGELGPRHVPGLDDTARRGASFLAGGGTTS